jgi:hypothetical protein
VLILPAAKDSVIKIVFYMSICTANSKRVNANSLRTVWWERRRHKRNLQVTLGEGNWENFTRLAAFPKGAYDIGK